MIPYKHAPPHMCYHAVFDRCGSNGTSLCTENHQQHWVLRIPPFKVTQLVGSDVTARSGTYDFLLTFHSYQGFVFWRFQLIIAICVAENYEFFRPNLYFMSRKGCFLEQWLKWSCEAGGSPDEARLEQTYTHSTPN